MGQQIIKQPNGKYALFSSVVDGFVLIDATRDEILEEWVSTERRRLDKHIDEVLTKISEGEKPYYQFTITWAEAKAMHNKNFPNDKVP